MTVPNVPKIVALLREAIAELECAPAAPPRRRRRPRSALPPEVMANEAEIARARAALRRAGVSPS